MITKDINLHESGSGGEMAIVSSDLLLGESLYQQVYLALFGGNVEVNTRGDELITDERFDYWGNSLFFGETQSKQFNSNTERTLLNVVLNSSGRLAIIQSIKDDLQYLNELLNFDADVEFLTTNEIKLLIYFTPKGSQENKVLQLIYNNAKNEIIIDKII
ncbi:hypothetical protein [Flavobacterium phage V157]|uniref:Uncharacterized protein n=20 Tax=Ficleduovirus TaxID=2560131 RepID=A0A0A0YNN4_9CAUD|nr:baseplate wedge subunit [Flavobacterium phage FCL-2]YP_009591117.1 baseplate wedge subunit [Flavobacterium phage FCV-1]ASD51615.1 hypothetical protein [Flavobacterium phage FCV-3]ASD51689.1 hypothetical protein [Flavobacterium phage FCV-11]ASD51763.1 hypothetical protein [Flavobacterium phage V175]ASD51841.1 hypothetical protein [Flavobacterium phage V181]ASD52519.1 hypothetical protein [Flavobacterium phage FCV-10]ASD52592.1 hypothetical protein [Flavobacterium phage FCV-16]ASD52666.1 h